MLVRKTEIIELLGAANLVAGDFINSYGQSCAVGSIVQAFSKGHYHPERIRALSELNAPKGLAPSALPYIESGDYMSALSIHFENVMSAYDDVYTEEVREEVLGFVSRFFPEELSIHV